MTSTKKSIGINFFTQYLELTIQFISVLILARLLTPADTGVYSVAAFLMILLHMFRDFGVVNYVIQEVNLTNEKIQSAFGVAIALALIVAAIMLLLSNVVADFYHNPALKSIFHVMALSFAVSPFGSLLMGLYRREMMFQKIFFIKTASALCHVAVSITLAYRGFGALSLAWANFAGILSFGVVANLYRPKSLPLLPKFSNIGKILSFGGIASLGNAANAIGTNSPDLVIAKTVDMAAVGYFSRGNGLVQIFAKLIASALTPIILPYFSQIKRAGGDLKKPYLLAVNYLTVLAWPFFSVMAIMALQIVNVLYGPQWNVSVPIVKLLCIAGAITSLTIFASHVMIANGQVRQATIAQLLSQPLKVIAVIAAAGFGLTGISIAIIAGECVTLFIVNRYLQMTIGVTFVELLKACWQSAIITLCSVISPLLVALLWTSPDQQIAELLLASAGAAGGWLIGIILTRHPLYEHMAQFLNEGYFPAPAAFSGRSSLMQTAKSCCKFLLFQFGIMRLYHWLRNRNVLTVVMFHRVLPADQIAALGADPLWTMSTDTFKQCLNFFRKNYHVITLEQLSLALQQQQKLPPRSLLITFDDGWADTEQYAQPVLEEYKLNSIVFVAGSVIGQSAPFWQEAIYRLLSTNPADMPVLNAALRAAKIDLQLPLVALCSSQDIRSIIAQLENQAPEQLRTLADQLQAGTSAPPAMLDRQALIRLTQTQTIGIHGHSHQQLTKVDDPSEEIRLALATLSEATKGKSVPALSFPHGCYDPSVVQACRAQGLQLLFSSDQILNRIDAQQSNALIFGRIAVSENDITDRARRFHPFMLAFWLLSRPIGTISNPENANGH